MNDFIKASDFCNFVTDGTHDSPKQSTEGYYLITSKHIKDGSIDFSAAYKISEADYQDVIKRSKVEKYDVLISMIGTPGECVYIETGDNPNYAIKNVGLFKMGGNKEKAYWLYYYLKSPMAKTFIKNMVNGSIQSYLTLGMLRDFPVLKMNSNSSIDVMYNMDNQIALNNKINRELEEMAQTLYNYWFVQFEFPNEEGKPYKSSGGKMVWSEELKREIPEGWEVKRLGDVCSTFLGGTPSRKKSEYWHGDINWINSGALNDSRIFTSSEKVTEKGVENSATKLLPSGTTVISITGNIMISLLEIEACTNQSVVGVTENATLPKEFIYFMCKNNKRYYESLMSGAVQQHINKDIIDNTTFIKPINDAMNNYRELIAPLFEEIKNNNKQNQKLIQLRDDLLPLLMNGQVTVSDDVLE